MLATSQEQVSDLALRLEDTPHERRQVRVQLHHFLELVEDQGHPSLPVLRDGGRHSKQLLERGICVEILINHADAKVEREGPIRVQRRFGVDAEVLEKGRCSLAGAVKRRFQPAVDGGGQVRSQALLARSPQQIDVGDQHALAAQVIDDAQHH